MATYKDSDDDGSSLSHHQGVEDDSKQDDSPTAAGDTPTLVDDEDDPPSSDSFTPSPSPLIGFEDSQSISSSSASSAFLPDGLLNEDEDDAGSILDDSSSTSDQQEQPAQTNNQAGSGVIFPPLPPSPTDSSNHDSVSVASSQQQRRRRNSEFRRMQRRERRRHRQRQRRYIMNILCFPCMSLFTLVILILLIIFMGLPFLMFLICLLSAYYCCTSDPLPPRVLIRALLDTEDWNANNAQTGQLHRRFDSKADIEKELIQRVCMGSWKGTMPKDLDDETTNLVREMIGDNLREVDRSVASRVHWKHEDEHNVADNEATTYECLVFSEVLSESNTRSQAIDDIEEFDKSKKAMELLLSTFSENPKSAEAVTKALADILGVHDGNEKDEDNAPEQDIQDDTSVRERGTVCDICLIGFEPEDVIAWSSNPKCDHAYHADCISDWLMRQPTCPSCRQEYLPESTKDEESPAADTPSSVADAENDTTPGDAANTSSHAQSSDTEIPSGSPDASVDSSLSISSTSSSDSDDVEIANPAITPGTDNNAQSSEESARIQHEAMDLESVD